MLLRRVDLFPKLVILDVVHRLVLHPGHHRSIVVRALDADLRRPLQRKSMEWVALAPANAPVLDVKPSEFQLWDWSDQKRLPAVVSRPAVIERYVRMESPRSVLFKLSTRFLELSNLIPIHATT